MPCRRAFPRRRTLPQRPSGPRTELARFILSMLSRPQHHVSHSSPNRPLRQVLLEPQPADSGRLQWLKATPLFTARRAPRLSQLCSAAPRQRPADVRRPPSPGPDRSTWQTTRPSRPPFARSGSPPRAAPPPPRQARNAARLYRPPLRLPRLSLRHPRAPAPASSEPPPRPLGPRVGPLRRRCRARQRRRRLESPPPLRRAPGGGGAARRRREMAGARRPRPERGAEIVSRARLYSDPAPPAC